MVGGKGGVSDKLTHFSSGEATRAPLVAGAAFRIQLPRDVNLGCVQELPTLARTGGLTCCLSMSISL